MHRFPRDRSSASSATGRPRRRRPLIATLAVASLVLPAAAEARTVRADNVYAYGQGDVSCYAVRYGSGIECMSEAVPSKFTDGYLGLRRTGKTRLGDRGDFPGYTTTRRKLRVGDVWRPKRKARGIVCRFESQGLRCTNRSKHGFLIEPKAYRRF